MLNNGNVLQYFEKTETYKVQIIQKTIQITTIVLGLLKLLNLQIFSETFVFLVGLLFIY